MSDSPPPPVRLPSINDWPTGNNARPKAASLLNSAFSACLRNLSRPAIYSSNGSNGLGTVSPSANAIMPPPAALLTSIPEYISPVSNAGKPAVAGFTGL